MWVEWSYIRIRYTSFGRMLSISIEPSRQMLLRISVRKAVSSVVVPRSDVDWGFKQCNSNLVKIHCFSKISCFPLHRHLSSPYCVKKHVTTSSLSTEVSMLWNLATGKRAEMQKEPAICCENERTSCGQAKLNILRNQCNKSYVYMQTLFPNNTTSSRY